MLLLYCFSEWFRRMYYGERTIENSEQLNAVQRHDISSEISCYDEEYWKTAVITAVGVLPKLMECSIRKYREGLKKGYNTIACNLRFKIWIYNESNLIIQRRIIDDKWQQRGLCIFNIVSTQVNVDMIFIVLLYLKKFRNEGCASVSIICISIDQVKYDLRQEEYSIDEVVFVDKKYMH